MNKYFLYARKSTDDEDRQVLSIEAQVTELKEFAAKEKLEIVASLCEAKTAKEPGRIVFGEMLKRIEKGEANGILAWHPDRLARNPIDGGKIIYLIDIGKIKSLKCPTFWFDTTPQGKFMLNIAFGQSKYYIDNLSENVKRGLRQKIRRGEYPRMAPLGYLNDLKTHKIVIDSKKYRLVKKMFELYSTGNYSLLDLKNTFNELGLRTQRNYSLSVSMIQNILKNPFYYGVFKFKGEFYQGIHEPIIAKKLFDQVQEVMLNRGRPHKKKKHNYIFTGLIKCGTCGCYITAERKKGHIYYRCTKKKGICDEKYLREEILVKQIKNNLQKVSLADDWADKMLSKLEKEKNQSAQSSAALVLGLKEKLTVCENKFDILLDSHLEGIIDKADYLQKKEQLINNKVKTEEEIKEIQNKGNNWLEPMRDFILSSKQAKKVAQEGDLPKMKIFLKNIGSNFILKGKQLEFLAKSGWRILAQSAEHSDWLPG